MASASQSLRADQEQAKSIRAVTLARGYEFCKDCGAWHHKSANHVCGYRRRTVAPQETQEELR